MSLNPSVTSPAEILRAARELISTPETWTTGVLARDSSGRSVDPKSGRAVCYCTNGALIVVGPEYINAAVLRAKGFLRLVIGQSEISIWNDENDHSAVVKGLDDAIALAEQATS